MAEARVNSTHVLLNPCVAHAEFAGADGEVPGGNSILTNYSAELEPNAGWDPASDGIRCINPLMGADGDNEFLGTQLHEDYEFDQVGPLNSTLDASSTAGGGKRLIYTHLYCTQASAINRTSSVGLGGGWFFFLFSDNGPSHDRTTDVRVWMTGGGTTLPRMQSPSPTTFVAVDAEHTASEHAIGTGTNINTGTNGSFDPAEVISAGWGHKSSYSGDDYYYNITRLGYYDEYTVYRGEVGAEADISLIYDKCLEENHYAMAKGGVNQYRPRMAIEFGDRSISNTDTTIYKDQNISIEFENAVQDTDTTLVRSLHAPVNKIGIEEKLRSGDVFDAINVSYSSQTAWHFRFAANVGATVTFSNCIIQNAGGTDDDCEIDADVLMTGGLIDSCGKLSINGGELNTISVSNPVSTAAVDITESSTLDSVTFSVDATNPAAYAIEIPDPGGTTDNYTLTNCTYSGFDHDIRVLGTTGTVNITVAGGDTPNVSVGTVTPETIALLGAGWVDGTSYTAVAGGGDDKRMIAVVVSSDGSKLPTGVTFGGTAMSLATSKLQDTIGLSIWYLMESTDDTVFTGSQTIAASWSGGAPSNITYQAATYDHVRQPQTAAITQATYGNSTSATATAPTVVNEFQSGRSASPSYTISAGANRLLVVIVNHEDNGQNSGATAVSWGGQSLTKQVEANDDNGYQTSQIWYLKEADIANGSGTTLSITASGDTPDYGAVVFGNVDQTTPFRSQGTDEDWDKGRDPDTGAVLEINDADMMIASFCSTSGDALDSWDDLMASPTASFSSNTGDDPSHGAYKAYSGSNVTDGRISATGGLATGNRTCMCVGIIIPSDVNSGNASISLVGRDEGLTIAALQFSEQQTNVTWTGDVTEQDEVDRTNETVSVAHRIGTAELETVEFGTADEETTVNADFALVGAHFQPSFTQSGGPTVNIITSPVTLKVIVLDPDGSPIQNARVLAEADSGGDVSVGTDIISGLTDVNGEISDTDSYSADQPITLRVRKASASPYYKPVDTVGTIDKDAGLTVTVQMQLDE